MVEGKTITTIQKGKAAEQELNISVAVSNMASPIITGASTNQISYIKLDVYVDNVSAGVAWKTQFGMAQSVKLKCKKGANIVVACSRPHYIPNQNMAMVPDYLCQSSEAGGEPVAATTVYNNVQEDLYIFYLIKKQPC